MCRYSKPHNYWGLEYLHARRMVHWVNQSCLILQQLISPDLQYVQYSYLHSLQYSTAICICNISISFYSFSFIVLSFAHQKRSRKRKTIQKKTNTMAKITFVKRKWLAAGFLIYASVRRVKCEEWKGGGGGGMLMDFYSISLKWRRMLL